MPQDDTDRQLKKAQENEASKEAAGVAAKGAVTYFTGGAGGQVYDAAKNVPVAGKVLDKAEGKIGKAANKATGGKFGKAAKKAKDMGALNAADQAMSMGKGKPSTSQAANQAKNVNQTNNAQKTPTNQNQGRNLLDGMKGNAKPKNNNGDDAKKQDRTKKALAVAKHIPLPHVQAAARVADKVNKAKGFLSGDSGEGLLGGSNKEEGSANLSGMLTFSMKKKIILYSIPAFLFLVIIMGLFSTFSVDVAGSSHEMNEGLCVSDYESKTSHNLDKCSEDSEEAKSFHKRVKEVKEEYAENNKEFDAIYIAGFYAIVSQTKGAGLTYDDMTKDKIKSIADNMFKEDDGSYTFDEDIFRKNLIKKVLPEYLPGKTKEDYEYIVDQIFKYVERYRELYGTGEIDSDFIDSDLASKLVQIAQHEFDTYKEGSRGNKYRNWLMPGSGYFAWCATFVSWCANEAGIPKSVITHSTAVDKFIEQARNQNTFHTPSSGYKPKPGDLIIWKKQLYSNSQFDSHIGIVKKYNSKTGKVETIEGNSNDAVRNNHWPLSGIGGFISPKYPASSSSSAGSIKNGKTITLPKGLGTEGSREFDLAITDTEINYARQQARNGRIVNPYGFPEKSNQWKVQNIWIKKGHKYKDGFCAIDGRILVATTNTFGTAGTKVDFYMSGGKVIKTIIIDTKNQENDGCTKWGHKNGACVLEFTGKTSKIGNNPYHALGLNGQTVVKAVKGESILK